MIWSEKKWLVARTAAVAAGFFSAKLIAKKSGEDKSIDDDNQYLLCTKDKKLYIDNSNNTVSEFSEINIHKPVCYELNVKPAIDRMLSFCGLVVCAPLYILISAAIVVDDPGPVFFAQKRVGKDKHFFMLHKFRTMKMSAPHDMPTHQLSDPERYITRVGRLLRRTSLDELPQMWDIFRGKMSVVGPRPALWNQEDLVGERDKYGANSVLPGLTGLAQISGRDELEILDKAKIDGEYCKNLSFATDIKCMVRTVGSVLNSDGIVEGGTGTIVKKSMYAVGGQNKYPLRTGVPVTEPAPEWGFRKTFLIKAGIHKRILITGAGSYIGESFRDYAARHYGERFQIDTLDMKDNGWSSYDFTPYDCVLHVAGIAHADVRNVDDGLKELYYKVNTDLAIEAAKKSKGSGVRQFVLMSSMMIYGSKEYVDIHTQPCPDNFYGDSKWQADKGVRAVADEDFQVAVLRPPMIYGRGTKGNYTALSEIARKVPVFPDVENRRSMLYIENLCEFLSLLILSGGGGIYVPQNAEYSKTSDIVKIIASVAGKKIRSPGILDAAVSIAGKMPGMIGNMTNKAFGNFACDQMLSRYEGLDYQKVGLAESIKRTEGR